MNCRTGLWQNNLPNQSFTKKIIIGFITINDDHDLKEGVKIVNKTIKVDAGQALYVGH